MSLEDLTGPNKYIANLVPANPPATDPAEQGCDHIQGIKNVLQNSFPGMAGAYDFADTPKSAKVQIGKNAAASENHFWDGSVSNQVTLKRGTPAAPGAELIKSLNGKLSFPSQAQLLSGVGYITLPGGLIVQWGSVERQAGNYSTTISFPIPFPGSVFKVIAGALLPAGVPVGVATVSYNASQVVLIYGDNTSSLQLDYIAIGN